jgi:hypothetical protein
VIAGSLRFRRNVRQTISRDSQRSKCARPIAIDYLIGNGKTGAGICTSMVGAAQQNRENVVEQEILKEAGWLATEQGAAEYL